MLGRIVGLAPGEKDPRLEPDRFIPWGIVAAVGVQPLALNGQIGDGVFAVAGQGDGNGSVQGGDRPVDVAGDICHRWLLSPRAGAEHMQG